MTAINWFTSRMIQSLFDSDAFAFFFRLIFPLFFFFQVDFQLLFFQADFSTVFYFLELDPENFLQFELKIFLQTEEKYFFFNCLKLIFFLADFSQFSQALGKNNFFPFSLRNSFQKKWFFLSESKIFSQNFVSFLDVFRKNISSVRTEEVFEKKNDFSPTIQNFEQNFLAGKNFPQEYFFSILFPELFESQNPVFFIKLKNFSGKKREKKCNWKLFFWNLEKTIFFSEKSNKSLHQNSCHIRKNLFW